MPEFSRQSLPVDHFIPEILEAIQTFGNLVITAAPGAGKTTRVPAALTKISKLKVAVLEPRRIAAALAASRVAQENGWNLGKEVGYEVRFDRRVSKETRLHFLTEALLLKKIVGDRSLSEFDIVVLDEFHERSLYTDVAIGLLRELQLLERPDLRIVVMSATLDASKVAEFLGGAPTIDVPGRLFPIEIQYDTKPQSLLWNPEVSQKTIDKIKHAVTRSSRDTLVFLPGQYEIQQCLRLAESTEVLRNFLKLPLHGQLSIEEQARAIQRQDKRKIIFSTNVAESSVTIEGLDCVVDSGLERSSIYQFNSGFQKLTTRRISQASATQRAGRSGRQSPGFCLRMWMPQDERSFTEFSQAEIKNQDLAETLLLLFALGISDPKNFMWFEAPPAAHLEMSLEKIKKLGLLKDSKLTELGKAVQKNPLPIRISVLLENFKYDKQEALGAWVAALLSERSRSNNIGLDPWECDVSSILSQLSGDFKRRIERASNQLYSKASEWSWNDSQVEEIKKIVSKSFADHLGKRREPGSARGVLANGRGVTLSKESQVKNSPYFVALEATDSENGNESKIHLATGLSEQFLITHFSSQFEVHRAVEWSDEKKEFFLKTEKKLWGLSLGNPTFERAQAKHVEENLPLVAAQNFDWFLKNSEVLRRWWSRVLFYHEHIGSLFETENSKKYFILKGFESASLGQRSFQDLLSLDLPALFESEMDPELIKRFHKSVPDELTALGGRRVKIHYTGEQAPYVELKIQHAFVWEKTPIIGNGILITVVLLAPNMRPTQVTKDLEGFWSGSYTDVRKELKARYPKHDWPEPRKRKS